ncbi:MAG: hypothetical protein R2728_04105 [Chitinophagales bacterium]
MKQTTLIWENVFFSKRNSNKNPAELLIATKIANSRESIIYKSEIKRKGDENTDYLIVRAQLLWIPTT